MQTLIQQTQTFLSSMASGAVCGGFLGRSSPPPPPFYLAAVSSLLSFAVVASILPSLHLPAMSIDSTVKTNRSKANGCSSESCHWQLWSHYVEKDCEPVYTKGECCPSRFICSEVELSDAIRDESCRFQGLNYPIGSALNHSDPCRKCLCRNGGPSLIPHAECMHIECTENFLPPDNDCILLYNEDECCSSRTHCTLDDFSMTEPEPVCHYGKRSYIEGERIEFDNDPCTVCICHRGFKGPTGPGCKKIDYCFLELQDHLANGCTPVYQEGRCCPVDWICPETSALESDTPNEENRCNFDGQSYPLNSTLPVNKDCVTCRCVTPPEFTCIQSACN